MSLIAQLKRHRKIIAVAIILATLGLFIKVVIEQNLVATLSKVPVLHIVGIILLYVAMLAILAAIYQLSARACKAKLSAHQNILLTIYSSIANFFGPLQSGPGVRAAYLKERHGVSLKKYTAISLWYYAIFAILSGLWFLAGWLPWQLAIPAIFVFSLGTILCLRWLLEHKGTLGLDLSLKRIVTLVALVVLQLIIVTFIYGIELHSVGANFGWQQLISYTGAANFALFVSLTPGALGFREAFLLLSRHVSGFSAETIVSANVLDRSLYIVFLGLLFCVSLLLHAQRLVATRAE